MVELKGSEKQIAWATKIRDSNLWTLNDELSDFKRRALTDGDCYNEIMEKIEKAIKDIEEGQSSAKWWIEHKSIAAAFLQRIKR